MVVMMDTLAIYEQFRAVLGEERAKGFAQTLGTMIEEAKNAATKDDIRQVRESLDASTARTDTRLDRLEAVVNKLAEAQLRTEARLDKLAEAQLRTEARLERLEAAVEKLVAITEKLVIRTDRHEGQLLELLFRDRLPSYLGLYLQRAKVLQTSDLLDDIEPRLDRAEVEDFLRADVLARGAIDGTPTYVVGEVSYTADADDVEQASRRSALLRKADLPAVGLVACAVIPPQTLAYAREQGVRVWADSRMLEERPPSP
jgi:hypothetical protein